MVDELPGLPAGRSLVVADVDRLAEATGDKAYARIALVGLADRADRDAVTAGISRLLPSSVVEDPDQQADAVLAAPVSGGLAIAFVLAVLLAGLLCAAAVVMTLMLAAPGAGPAAGRAADPRAVAPAGPGAGRLGDGALGPGRPRDGRPARRGRARAAAVRRGPHRADRRRLPQPAADVDPMLLVAAAAGFVADAGRGAGLAAGAEPPRQAATTDPMAGATTDMRTDDRMMHDHRADPGGGPRADGRRLRRAGERDPLPPTSCASSRPTASRCRRCRGSTSASSAGELVAVVGASGLGQVHAAVDPVEPRPADRGRARVAGHDLLTMRRRSGCAFRRRSVGFVWQQTSRNLLPYLTAGENVAAALAITGAPAAARRRRARVDELLDLLEVVALRRAPARPRCPAASSSGSRSRSASPTTRACCSPTSRPASSTTRRARTCSRRCASVNRELGVTTLIVTHDPRYRSTSRAPCRSATAAPPPRCCARPRLDEHGAEQHVAEEYAVLDRVGRLQLPR